MPERFRRILVVDLLGGLGDLVMLLPVLHALSRCHTGAALTVLTHEPGAALVCHEPAVAHVRTAPRGRERAAVAAALDAGAPDLVVSTTRHSGIPDEIAARRVRCVTDLWRRPPPDRRIEARYLEILAGEGLVEDPLPAGADVPRLTLTAAERRDGERILAAHAPAARPIVLVPEAGMAVKRWPHWSRLVEEQAAGAGRAVLTVAEHAVPGAGRLPALPLRRLAAVFAAVGAAGGVVLGGDTGPVRVAAAAGARTVGLFGPTTPARYGLPGGTDLHGLPGCPHRRPTAVTEQVCWWDAHCPLSATGPACMADIAADEVGSAADAALGSAADAALGSAADAALGSAADAALGGSRTRIGDSR
jgi:ADP-heptose:LPS heptosyltransferase